MRLGIYELIHGYYHRACARSLAAREREAALHAVTEAIAVLEDEECLNAGEAARSSLYRSQTEGALQQDMARTSP